MPTQHTHSRERRARALEAIPPLERERTETSLRVTRAFRGVTLEQAAGYLESIGGERVEDRTVAGTGWKATLSATEEPVGPSYRLTTVTITWSGDPEAVDTAVFEFRMRAFRAPG